MAWKWHYLGIRKHKQIGMKQMNNTVTDTYGNEITIKSIAELTVKSNAFFASKTMRTKRGGNPFTMRAARHTRLLANANGIEISDVEKQVRTFIAQNPMRYFPTSERFEYVGA
jgi:hypothetical protein